MNDDYGVIDNFAGFIVDIDDPDLSTNDFEAGKMIMRSTRPPHPPETNILKKRRRYIAWSQETERIEEDMTCYHNAVQYIHKELRTLERKESRWHESFEFARKILTGCLNSCKNENRKMTTDGDRLKAICAKEIGRLDSRKKKNTFSRDLMVEMNNRQDNIERLIERYEELLEDLAPRTSGEFMPVTHVEIDEKTGKRWEDAVAGQQEHSKQASTLGEKKEEPMLRRSLRNADSAVEKAENVEIDPAVKLENMLHPIDDSSILDTKHCPEIEAFYNPEDPQWVFPEQSIVSTEEDKNWHPVPTVETEKLLAEPYFKLDRRESSWHILVESLCAGASVSDALKKASEGEKTHPMSSTSASSQLQTLYRPKRSTSSELDAIHLKSFVTARAPRGVPLIISPFSQSPDRYIGAVLGVGRALDNSTPIETVPSSSSKNCSYADTAHFSCDDRCMDVNAKEYKVDELSISSHLLRSEDEEMKKCQLKSAIMAGKYELNKLRSSNADWAKVVGQSRLALEKAKSIHANITKGEFMESRLHRKELIHYGLASAAAGEEPMSPLMYPEGLCYGDLGNSKSKKIIGKKNSKISHNNDINANNGASTTSNVSDNNNNSNNENFNNEVSTQESSQSIEDDVYSSPSKSDVAVDEPTKRMSRSQAAALNKEKSPEIIKREQQLETLSALRNKITVEEEKLDVKAAPHDKKASKKKKR